MARLLDLLDVDPERYHLDFQGYSEYAHKFDPNRECDVETIFLPMLDVGRFHPYSSDRHSRRATDQTIDRLEQLEEKSGFDYVLAVDLTLPKEVSDRCLDGDYQKAVRDAVSASLGSCRWICFGGRDPSLERSPVTTFGKLQNRWIGISTFT